VADGGITIDQALARAVQHHQRGELQQAEGIYRQILAIQPNNAQATHLLGVVAHQLGRNDVALELMQRSLAAAPNEARFYSNLSEVLRALQRPQEAVAALRKALALQPDEPDFTSNLGVALLDVGNVAAAEATLRRAIALKSSAPEPHVHLSRLLRDRQEIEAALAEARRAVEIAPPRHLNALLNLGLTLMAAGQLSEAEAHCRRGIELDANSYLAHSSLASVLVKMGRHEEAAREYARSIELMSNYAPAHAGLAAAMSNLGRNDVAIAEFGRALQLAPDEHTSHAGLGLAYLHAGRLTESVDATRQALRLHPDWPDYMNNLAVALEEMGRFDEATEVLQRAATLTPPLAHVKNNLAKRLSAAGRIEEAVAHFRRAIELAADKAETGDEAAQIHSNLLLTLHYLPEISPPRMFDEHIEWARRYAKPVAEKILPHRNKRSIDQRLRIGYVSPDLAAHSVADFLEPILSHHDHERVEIYCYSDVPRPDSYTQRLRAYADVWVDISREKDNRVVEMIRDHGIDILVDLAGHTARNRMLVFARKPAPVQVTYLGYPDTTGQTAIDWRITDGAADPPGMTEEFHTESLLRLPRTFLCYRPFPDAAAVAPLPADSSAGGNITFASFNNLSKITPRVIEAWARVLSAAPGSRMLIKAAVLEGSPRDRLREKFKHHGIAAERLDLIGRVADFGEHLALYNKVDIALDTFPYHGTTTTAEALWMGVPVVTLIGQTHMSRVGLSLLGQLGLSELATETMDQYVAAAGALASDRARLRELRRDLRDRMRVSPLLDAAGVTRELEDAYRSMWRKWVTRS